ncbi:unnamed protein product [Rotaria magnacalcarata]|uniref:Uncharacterized protein n=1 Tax=Rotaria magnacalcarata TaxID=392030 RepID=A0A815RHD1_9BILA|nr:unnamed protein product [Rotaria magnacalcarata]CAF1475893.1 unnamed protein product [Rotaria magnacalcarata]CAF2083645.1 unnamed protein product [Rotaria magnacalcarata]CAF3827227.1 unnamed protein product [Rotaria magnacalcarata]CAF3892997.1 unnamed protein product [Rotaria magnacalcarata]
MHRFSTLLLITCLAILIVYAACRKHRYRSDWENSEMEQSWGSRKRGNRVVEDWRYSRRRHERHRNRRRTTVSTTKSTTVATYRSTSQTAIPSTPILANQTAANPSSVMTDSTALQMSTTQFPSITLN